MLDAMPNPTSIHIIVDDRLQGTESLMGKSPTRRLEAMMQIDDKSTAKCPMAGSQVADV
jgi:hypothetical protein